jgi:hypothetical protein
VLRVAEHAGVIQRDRRSEQHQRWPALPDHLALELGKVAEHLHYRSLN